MDNFTKLNVTKSVTIQPLAVGRAARAINGLAHSPRAGEGARSTPYASGKALNSYQNLTHHNDQRHLRSIVFDG
ncbi:MAG: hypothetical protein EPN89_07090 [Methylovulum sp.]|nr:MAG: hypothetical protein EPN89_07090 [Methylovulum sp.]